MEDHDPARDEAKRDTCLAETCQRPAIVCDECVRALALKWFGAITRHGEGVHPVERCELCEIGRATWCGEHALLGEYGVVARRRWLRQDHAQIGDPDFFAHPIGMMRGPGVGPLAFRRSVQLTHDAIAAELAGEHAGALALLDEAARVLGATPLDDDAAATFFAALSTAKAASGETAPDVRPGERTP